MGIFDNIDWQQMMPALMGGLSAGAAYRDPRSGPMLANSGWQAVQSYMQQKRMDQQKEEFEARQKQADKELAMRQKHLDIATKDEERKNLAQLNADALSQSQSAVFDEYHKTGEIPSLSQAWGKHKEISKGLGLTNPDSSSFVKEYNSYISILDGKDGPVALKMNPNGGIDVYDHSSGKLWPFLQKALRPQDMKRLTEDPWTAEQIAIGLENQAKAEKDPKSKAALLNVASGFNAKVEEKDQEVNKDIRFRIGQADSAYDVEVRKLERRFGTVDADGNYRDNPYKMAEPNTPEDAQRKAWNQKINKTFDDLSTARTQQITGLMSGMKISRKNKGAAKDSLGTKGPWGRDEEEQRLYNHFLNINLQKGMSPEDTIVQSRAEAMQAWEEAGKAREKTMRERRREVSKKPPEPEVAKRMGGGTPRAPVSVAPKKTKRQTTPGSWVDQMVQQGYAGGNRIPQFQIPKGTGFAPPEDAEERRRRMQEMYPEEE